MQIRREVFPFVIAAIVFAFVVAGVLLLSRVNNYAVVGVSAILGIVLIAYLPLLLKPISCFSLCSRFVHTMRDTLYYVYKH